MVAVSYTIYFSNHTYVTKIILYIVISTHIFVTISYIIIIMYYGGHTCIVKIMHILQYMVIERHPFDFDTDILSLAQALTLWYLHVIFNVSSTLWHWPSALTLLYNVSSTLWHWHSALTLLYNVSSTLWHVCFNTYVYSTICIHSHDTLYNIYTLWHICTFYHICIHSNTVYIIPHVYTLTRVYILSYTYTLTCMHFETFQPGTNILIQYS